MVSIKSHFKQYELQATNIATVELKSPVVANMVMLGALSALTDIISKTALINAIKETVNEKFIELNLRGIDIGFEKGKQLKQ
jgi:2-oxoglutarate ferredoxin oxidoreductase subunit gamma